MSNVTFKLPDSDKVYSGTIVRHFDGGKLVDCVELGRHVSIEDSQIESQTDETNETNETSESAPEG